MAILTALRQARAMAKQASSRAAWHALGVLLECSGRNEEALEAFRRALRHRSGPRHLHADIHLHLAHVWLKLGNRKAMRHCLRRALSLPAWPRTEFNRAIVEGNALLEAGEFQDAFDAYAAAARAAPDRRRRGRAAANQGLALLRLGNQEAARASLDRANRLYRGLRPDGDAAVALMARAGVYFDLGRKGLALRLLNRAAETFRRLRWSERRAEALGNAGYVAVEMRAWKAARPALDRAIILAYGCRRRDILARAYGCRAEVAAQEGFVMEAHDFLRRAETLLRSGRHAGGAMYPARSQARVALSMGDPQRVERAAWRGLRAAEAAGDVLRAREFRDLRAEARGRAKRRVRAVPRERLPLSRKLASTDLPLLLVGAGSLEWARRLHEQSGRAGRPCATVACERLSFPASDLGGHAEGAWTGAGKAAAGLIEEAEGGTVVLDRLDLLEPAKQRVLIPLLEKRLRPVGGTRERRIDVRMVATCENPARILPALRARLSGVVLQVPPPAGIVSRVRAYLRGRRRIATGALEELARRAWPGGAAELEGALERLILASDRVITRAMAQRALRDFRERRAGRDVQSPSC